MCLGSFETWRVKDCVQVADNSRWRVTNTDVCLHNSNSLSVWDKLHSFYGYWGVFLTGLKLKIGLKRVQVKTMFLCEEISQTTEEEREHKCDNARSEVMSLTGKLPVCVYSFMSKLKTHLFTPAFNLTQSHWAVLLSLVYTYSIHID